MLLCYQTLYDKHYRGILATFVGLNEHFSGKNGALRWSILVGKQKHNVQKPAIGPVKNRTHLPDHKIH